MISLDALDALASKATPGKRYQMCGKYMSFDYGETPQVFRAITDADEQFIIACDRDTIQSLLRRLRAAERVCRAIEDDHGLFHFIPFEAIARWRKERSTEVTA